MKLGKSNLLFAIALSFIVFRPALGLQVIDDKGSGNQMNIPNVNSEQQDSLLSRDFDTLDTTRVDTTTADSNHSELVSDLVKPLILTGLLGGLLLLLFTQRGGR